MRVKTAGGPRRPGATSLPERVGVAPRRRKVQFDDQRPGWDFTTSDIGKFKLTPEQVEVRVRRVHGASRSRAASLTPRVLPFPRAGPDPTVSVSARAPATRILKFHRRP